HLGEPAPCGWRDRSAADRDAHETQAYAAGPAPAPGASSPAHSPWRGGRSASTRRTPAWSRPGARASGGRRGSAPRSSRPPWRGGSGRARPGSWPPPPEDRADLAAGQAQIPRDPVRAPPVVAEQVLDHEPHVLALDPRHEVAVIAHDVGARVSSLLNSVGTSRNRRNPRQPAPEEAVLVLGLEATAARTGLALAPVSP